MSIDWPSYLENRRKYLQNRPQFPLDELAKYSGQWVAWSPDGTRIIAGTQDLETLESLVRAAGEHPTQCVIEGIPEEDAFLSGDFPAEYS